MKIESTAEVNRVIEIISVLDGYPVCLRLSPTLWRMLVVRLCSKKVLHEFGLPSGLLSHGVLVVEGEANKGHDIMIVECSTGDVIKMLDLKDDRIEQVNH